MALVSDFQRLLMAPTSQQQLMTETETVSEMYANSALTLLLDRAYFAVTCVPPAFAYCGQQETLI